jgi:hypothetical protein
MLGMRDAEDGGTARVVSKEKKKGICTRPLNDANTRLGSLKYDLIIGWLHIAYSTYIECYLKLLLCNDAAGISL